MKRNNWKVLKNSVGVAMVAAAPFLFDKMADYYVSSVASDDKITTNEILFLVCILLLAALVMLGIQKGAAIIKFTLRNVRNEPRLENLQKRIKKLGDEIIEISRMIRNSEALFNSEVDSASREISRLSAKDARFLHSREAVAHKVIGLKSIYKSNISDLEKLASKVYREIDEADKVLKDARKMAGEDVKAVLGKTK